MRPAGWENQEVVMNRIAKIAMLLLLMLCLFASSRSSAQETTEKQTTAKTAHKRAAQWEQLAEGVRVLRLWQTSLGPAHPQIAVLELEREEYKQFVAAPTNYLEKHDVFKLQNKSLRGVVSAVDLSVTRPGKAPTESMSKDPKDPPPNQPCTATIVHTSWCTAAYISYCP
jgi:hypothetical protein